MTVLEFYRLIKGFDKNSELEISRVAFSDGIKNGKKISEDAVPVEQVVVDFDAETKRTRIILG